MGIFKAIVFGIGILFVLSFFVRIYADTVVPNKRIASTKFIVRVAIFGSISTILYIVPIFNFAVPIFPSFMKLHFDEIPIFIAGFAYGPWSAVCILLIKTMIKLPMTSTLCVGELTDFIFSLVFILPATLIYNKKRDLKHVVIGVIVGSILQIITSIVLNIYVMVPFYSWVMGLNYEQLFALCQKANINIKDAEWSFGLMAVLPFNAIKDAAVIFITMIIYKATHILIDKIV